MKVSVIMPTHKREDKIAVAVKSVLSQTYRELELVIVDDNPPGSESRANTKYQISKFVDDRIIYIENAQNLGGALSRNNGIRASSGEMITFLDDDDYYMPDKLERQVEFMLSGGYDMMFSDCEIVNSSGARADLRTHPLSRDNENEALLKAHLISPLTPTMTYMLTREAIFKLGLFDDRPVSQEYMLMLKAIEAKLKIGYLNKALCVQVVHEGERISFGANKIDGERRLLNEKLKYSALLSKGEKKRMICRFYALAAFVSLRRREFAGVARYGLAACFTSPVDAWRILFDKKGMLKK